MTVSVSVSVSVAVRVRVGVAPTAQPLELCCRASWHGVLRYESVSIAVSCSVGHLPCAFCAFTSHLIGSGEFCEVRWRGRDLKRMREWTNATALAVTA